MAISTLNELHFRAFFQDRAILDYFMEIFFFHDIDIDSFFEIVISKHTLIIEPCIVRFPALDRYDLCSSPFVLNKPLGSALQQVCCLVPALLIAS